MTKLNWRDASKELPQKSDTCLVIYKNKGFYKDPFEFNFYIPKIKCWGVNDDEVSRWIYADEVPLPEEEL